MWRALGGAIGGGSAIAKGQNFWHGNAIAQGRGMFSWKNTPVGETGALSSVPEVMPGAIVETPNDVSTYQSTSKVVYDEPSNPETLIHYTTENGYKSIMESKQLLPSVGIKHARYGDGQYFTDLNSIDYTVGQLSRRLYRVPWNKSHLTHF
ncbi:secreted protein, partial [gut metagenome]